MNARTASTADAFVVAVQLPDYPKHEGWEDRRRAPSTSLRAGDVTIYDQRRDPRFQINNAFHSAHFQLTRSLLGQVGRGTRRVARHRRANG